MVRRYGHLPAAFALLMMITLAGCGGGGGDSSAVTTSAGSLVVTAAILAPGAVCPNGGISVESGIDENLNGLLDSTEVDAVQYVCNGVDGIDGQTALVLISPEPAGDNCAAGGSKVESGLDASNDGVLDIGEVSHTSYVCDALDGSNGVDGLTTLLAITPEPAGDNCTYGGQLITSGLDADHDTILDPEEITTIGYACNGAPAGIGWIEVTGTTQQAEPNMGYLVNNAAQVVVTLPTVPVVGDIVEIVGKGTGGWKVAQNEGQYILPMFEQRAWTGHNPTGDWSDLATSSDGFKLLAANSSGYLYTSSDGGVNWVVRTTGLPSGNWKAVASSADGAKLAAAQSPGNIYTSIDSGATWTMQASAPSLSWMSLASSADGVRLLAAQTSGYLYASEDSGATWSPVTSAPSSLWYSVASSADGTKLIAGSNQVIVSTDSGATWMNVTPPGGLGVWVSVAVSDDGTRLVALPGNNGPISSLPLFISADSGTTWTAVYPASAHAWTSVALSSNGSTIFASNSGGFCFLSVDSGTSWQWQDDIPAGSTTYLASSSTGDFLAGAVTGGQIFTRKTKTSTGTAGGVYGQQWDTVELQYVGAGTFMVRSYDGDLSFQ